MIQLRIVPARSSMIQLNSEIKMEPEDDLALSYLATQFPNDYETRTEEQKKKEQQPPSQQQILAQEKAEMEAYAKQVAQEASDYQNQIDQKEKEKIEAHHFDGLDEEAMVQL